jgi:hypothetical protein
MLHLLNYGRLFVLDTYVHNGIWMGVRYYIFTPDAKRYVNKSWHVWHFGVENCTDKSSLGRYVFGSEISYNKAPPRLPGLGC